VAKIGLKGLDQKLDQLLENRIYRDGTVDAVLEDNAVLVTEDQYEQLSAPPDFEKFAFDDIRKKRILLLQMANQYAPSSEPIQKLFQLATFTRNLEKLFPSPEHPAYKYYKTPDDFWWGGTEEMVMTKGSDWCAEVARLYCALTQVCGIPSRIVYTMSSDGGHVISECFADGKWVLVDPLAPKVYTKRNGHPIGVVEMVSASKEEFEEYTSSPEGVYIDKSLFKYVGVSEYRIAEADQYDYGISKCNDYYRKILEPIWNK
jgi:hypothetical protein